MAFYTNTKITKSVFFILLVGIAAFFVFVFKVWAFTADDTYIGLRYAKNLVDGFGLMSWNRGEQPVAGLTNVFWVAIQTLPYIFKVDPVIFSKILGVILMLLSAGIIFSLASFIFEKVGGRAESGKLAGALSVMLFLVQPITAIHAVSGMETALFIFLFILFFYLLIRASQCVVASKMTGCALFIGITALALGLTRPEGNLLVVIGLFLSLIIFRQFRTESFIFPILLSYVVPGALYILWRLNFFGFIWPNSLYLKVLFTHKIFGGGDMSFEFFKYIFLHFGLFIILSIFFVRKYLLPMLLSLAAYYVFYFFPIHFMGYNFRFLYPLFPFICVFSSLGLVYLFLRMENNLLSKCVKFLIVAMLFASLTIYARGNIVQRTNYAAGLERGHIFFGKILKKIDPVGLHTIAISDAGAVPYFSDWRVIDTFGLNENNIARSKKRDIDYIFERNPDLIVVISGEENSFEPMLDFEKDIYDQALKLGMKKVDYFSMDSSYSLWVFAYPENPIAKKLLTEHYPDKNQ